MRIAMAAMAAAAPDRNINAGIAFMLFLPIFPGESLVYE
jgi:hypothetical protein